jgi:hypothetical protein
VSLRQPQPHRPRHHAGGAGEREDLSKDHRIVVGKRRLRVRDGADFQTRGSVTCQTSVTSENP